VGDPATKLRNQPLRAGLQPQKREAVENCDAHRNLPFTGMPDSKIAGPDDVLEIFEWRGSRFTGAAGSWIRPRRGAAIEEPSTHRPLA